jgi:D-alanyl-D-alanine carboxypeptidase
MNEAIASLSLTLFIFGASRGAPLTLIPSRAAEHEPPLPSIAAQYAIVISGNTGAVIGVKDPDSPHYLGSITKIMTALIALERGNLDHIVTVGHYPTRISGSSMRGCPVNQPDCAWPVRLEQGEELTLWDLLYGMLLPSGVDAAGVVAEYIVGCISQDDWEGQICEEGFVRLMNNRAVELELSINTWFETPHGADRSQSTARDVAKLAAYALTNPTFATIVQTLSPEFTVTSMKNGLPYKIYNLKNTNRLLDENSKYFYPGANGVKTGTTAAAGANLVSSATRSGNSLIAVVMGAFEEDGDPCNLCRYEDSRALLSYGFNACRIGDKCLGGRGITISPGHGWYWNEAENEWLLQRDYFWGIVEDFVNADIAMYLNTALVATGADVRPTRDLDKTAGIGESGYPKWEEAARYYIKSLGAPSSVWDEPGFSQLLQDIRSRPNYANWVNADILVGIHNNIGGGTGTETWYDTSNGWQDKSRRLAEILQKNVVNAIRENYNPMWVDRGLRGCNGCKGENRLAAQPSIIIEIAFMDTGIPDNLALQDEVFKSLVAEAINQGIQEYFIEQGEESITDLGMLATVINNKGQVGGVRDPLASVWIPSAPNGTSGSIIDLGTLAGCCSEATGINDNESGEVVGWSYNAQNDYFGEPLLWK